MTDPATLIAGLDPQGVELFGAGVKKSLSEPSLVPLVHSQSPTKVPRAGSFKTLWDPAASSRHPMVPTLG